MNRKAPRSIDDPRRRGEYMVRINRAIDYIEVHLDTELTLDTIANEAHFSRFHFHRLFTALVGETLNSFIGRLRVERAANQLLANPAKPITGVALDCGFSGSAAFARAFRQAYGMSASQWREGGCRQFRKDGKTERNQGKDAAPPADYSDGIIQQDVVTGYDHVNQLWRIAMPNTRKKDKPLLEAEVEIVDRPERPVAYVRHVGPYAGDEALFERLWGELCRWAGPRGLMSAPDLEAVSVYHDNPELTEEARLRTSICITVPEGTKGEGSVGTMVLEGGRCAVARFELAVDEFPEAWQAVYAGWLPDSGYQPDDRPPFELYRGDPKEHPEGKHLVDICVPVRPL